MQPTVSGYVLLVRRAESDLLSVDAAGKMTRVLRDCRLVQVPNAGHSVNLGNPQGFIQAVRPFLLERLA